MHLKSLEISRFRSCEDLSVVFHPDLTVLVGENNGGKTNIVEAIRLLTSPLNGRRDRYPEEDDLRRGATERSFQIKGEFKGLSDPLRGLLISAMPDPLGDSAVFGLKHQLRTTGQTRGKSIYWAGRYDTHEPEVGSSDLIRHVYLPALRDAHQALGTGSGARVMTLLRHFVGVDDEGAFLEALRRPTAQPNALGSINTAITEALGELTSGVRLQRSEMNFEDETMFDVARDLRFRLADHGMELEDIRASGLGYSNLLYMATVVVELAKAKEADLTLFLVEEPEAHLHPQLQAVVLEFLRDKAHSSANRQRAAGEPEGRIQVIVTTHSPNLTAWVDPKHLVVLKTKHTLAEGGQRSESACIPIAELGIPPKILEKISRYLDVTRSGLLFGNRAVLVEGIAEALLLPVIARKIVLAGEHEAWLRFKGTLIIPIEGVDFRPYVEILTRPYRDARIAQKLIVVTDADPSVRGNRKGNLERLAQRHGANGVVTVLVNTRTLEFDLFPENEALLKRAFLSLHRNSSRFWADEIEALPEAERPAKFLDLLTQKRTRKGDLAQQICSLIQDGEPFVVPAYLRDAITAAAAE
ncbi:ATP-dependent endonuclease [Luteolibacter sp. Populi]|uniref:ATP-dependent nuclease n=1 Tax=Luteolibacter sp. Populi TaxID=3230487 RepID=UPI003466AF12